MGDDNKRRLWWVWAIWGAFFVVLELVAIYTKEKALPTLSRTIWWIIDRLGLPARIFVGVVIIWLFFHLTFGECAFGLC